MLDLVLIPLCQGQCKNLRVEVKSESKSAFWKSQIQTKHIKNKNLEDFLLKSHELSTRESTLESFRRINDVWFGNSDLKINININCIFINTISI